VTTFQVSTELMKNQKAAQVLSDQSEFDALQTSDGNALFFGISDTAILYVTQEQQSVTTGWTPVDLTTELSALLPGLTVSAKTFAVSQSASTGEIVVAQVVHTAEDDQDHLFVLGGLSYAPGAAWLASSENRTWVPRAYDDTANPLDPVALSYVRLESSQDTQLVPYLVAGVVARQTSYVSNYLVSLDPGVTTGVWQQYVTAENYTQLLGMAMGMPQSSLVFGLYELYTLSGNTSLTFTPSGSLYGPGPVVVTKLDPPSGASAIAVLPVDAEGHTNLYVAAEGSIHLFVPAQQTNTGTSVAVITDALVTGVDLVEVNVVGDLVTLWARNGDGTVFYSRCTVEGQADPAAWSAPIPIGQGADQVASSLNLVTGASSLFLHTSGENLQQLTQDPVTTQWSSRPLLLPPLATDDVYEAYTFTTHVNVLDASSMAAAASPVTITATSPVAVYLNDVYTTLTDATPLTVAATDVGTVTIVQQTETLGAVCYALVADDGTTATINPMSGPLATLSGVTTGSDLDVTVTDELGNTAPLVPAAVTPAQQDAVAQCVQQFAQVAQSLPSDGSVSGATAYRPAAPTELGGGGAFGLSFADADVQFITEVGDVTGAVEAFAGDVLRWIEGVVDDVVRFVVQVSDDVAHFFVTLGDDIYHFVLTCVSDVMHGVQFVFAKIGVAFDKLVQWLGFIFSWNDILRTHAVIRTFFSCYITYSIDNLETYKAGLITLCTSLQDTINTWARLPQPSQSLGGEVAAAGSPPGQSSPAANWGTHQLHSNASGATTTASTDEPDVSAFAAVFEDILAAIEQEGDDIKAAYTAIKTQIVDQLATLSVATIMERLFAIIADLVVETLENIVIAVIDVLAAVVQGVLSTLDAPIDIPVLSWIYQKYAGAPLSFMDLACLITAIPATIIYKIAHGAAPFPDTATTTALIDAPDFATIRTILAQPAAEQASAATRAALSGAAALGGGGNALVAPVLGSAGDNWKFSANVLALAASVGVSIFSGIKIYYPTSAVASVGNALFYIPYCSPDFGIATPQSWDQIMNEAITGISIVKALVDISLFKFVKGGENGAFLTFWSEASPFVEYAISTAWMVPTIWALSRSTSLETIVSVAANVSFNATGIISLGAIFDPESISKGIFTGVVVATILAYGAGIFASSFLSSDTTGHWAPGVDRGAGPRLDAGPRRDGGPSPATA
jgi:hypothetical protein